MNQHILIVDDESSMLRNIEAALKQEGFTVASCRSGELALEWAAERPPLLIIMDFIMPGMDGLETLRYMRVLPSLNNIPVLLLADKGYAPDAAEAGECGVQAVLTKPFNQSQLLDEVKRLLAVSSVAA